MKIGRPELSRVVELFKSDMTRKGIRVLEEDKNSEIVKFSLGIFGGEIRENHSDIINYGRHNYKGVVADLMIRRGHNSRQNGKEGIHIHVPLSLNERFSRVDKLAAGANLLTTIDFWASTHGELIYFRNFIYGQGEGFVDGELVNTSLSDLTKQYEIFPIHYGKQ